MLVVFCCNTSQHNLIRLVYVFIVPPIPKCTIVRASQGGSRTHRDSNPPFFIKEPYFVGLATEPFFLEAAPFGSLWIPLVVHVLSCASLQLISKHPTSAWKGDEPTLLFRVELLGFSVASSATCSRWDFYTQGIVECRHVLGSTRVICPSRDISDRGPVSAAGGRAPWLRMDMSE